jgi:hypothetical protein
LGAFGGVTMEYAVQPTYMFHGLAIVAGGDRAFGGAEGTDDGLGDHQNVCHGRSGIAWPEEIPTSSAADRD